MFWYPRNPQSSTLTWFLSCLKTTLLEDSVFDLSIVDWASFKRALVRRKSFLNLKFLMGYLLMTSPYLRNISSFAGYNNRAIIPFSRKYIHSFRIIKFLCRHLWINPKKEFCNLYFEMRSSSEVLDDVISCRSMIFVSRSCFSRTKLILSWSQWQQPNVW